MDKEDLLKRLTTLVGDETKAKEIADKAAADGATDVAGAALLTEADWTGYGLLKVKARQLVRDLAEAAKPAQAPAPAPTTAPLGALLLPTVPTDDSFLSGLVIGGVLKPGKNDVLAAIRALNAGRYGIFDIDDKILEAIATRAEEMQEPWPDIYYTVQKKLAVKAHAEVLQALGVSSKVVSKAATSKFLTRMSGIWNELAGFYEMVDGYVQNWQTQMGPTAMMAIMGSALAGGVGGPSPFAQEAPDATPLVDQARGIIDRINKMFAGPGIPVARALAADAQQLSEILKNPDLINAIGATNRDEMLRKLGVAVGADASRSETSMLQFALCVLDASTVEVSQLPRYILAMRQVGATIPWSTFNSVNGTHGAKASADSRLRTPAAPYPTDPFGAKPRTF